MKGISWIPGRDCLGAMVLLHNYSSKIKSDTVGVVSVSLFWCPWPAAPAVTESIPKQKFHVRWTEISVNADVLWRGDGAPRGKTWSTIFHYGVKQLEQNKIVFDSTITTAMSSKIQFILQSSRFLAWRRLCNFVLCDDCPIYFSTTHSAAWRWMKNHGIQFSDTTRCLTMTFATNF